MSEKHELETPLEAEISVDGGGVKEFRFKNMNGKNLNLENVRVTISDDDYVVFRCRAHFGQVSTKPNILNERTTGPNLRVVFKDRDRVSLGYDILTEKIMRHCKHTLRRGWAHGAYVPGAYEETVFLTLTPSSYSYTQCRSQMPTD